MTHPLVKQYLEEGHTREEAIALAKKDTSQRAQLLRKNAPIAEVVYLKTKLSKSVKHTKQIAYWARDIA